MIKKQILKKPKIMISKTYAIWFLIFFAYVNPAYLDRFSVFGYLTTLVKLSVFAYFVILLIKKKIKKAIIPWLGYALFPTIITILGGGNVGSALVYSFIVISLCLMLFYVKDRHLCKMIGALALLMEILVVINLLTILLFPQGLYVYQTDAGWWSSDVWFFGLRNSHSPYLYFACFASMLDSFSNPTSKKKIIAIFTHFVSIITIFLLQSGGGIIGFGIYFIMLLVLMHDKVTTLKPIIFKSRTAVSVNIGIFVFLSFFAANTAIGNLFMFLGEQRVYTFGRRLGIWSTVWEHIMQNPITGIGFMNAEDLEWLSTIAAGAVTSHNSMMDICLRGGLITFLIYCILLYSSASSIDKNNNIGYKMKNYIAISWFTILLLLQSEGAMMSIPLLVTVGLTYRIGIMYKNEKL